MPYPAPDAGSDQPVEVLQPIAVVVPTETIGAASSGSWDPVGLLYAMGDWMYGIGNVFNAYVKSINSIRR